MVGTDGRPRAEHTGPLDDVLEFAHVARPAVLQKQLPGLIGQAVDRLAHLGGDAGDEMVGEQEDVVAALAQGRQDDVDDAQAEIEVLTEGAAAHLFLEVHVGGGDHPDIDVQRRVLAHRVEGALLEEAQEAQLHERRDVADLVEEQGAAVRLEDAAETVAVGAGERALAVPEQLALQERLGDGGAVDLDQRPVLAVALQVQGLGGEFLAGAGFAGDEHGQVDPAHVLDHGVRRLHGIAGAEEAVELLTPPGRNSLHRRLVADHHHCPGQAAGAILERRGGHTQHLPAATGALALEIARADLAAGLERLQQVFLERRKLVAAAQAGDAVLFGQPGFEFAQQQARGRVHLHDAQVHVHGDNTVGHALEHGFEEGAVAFTLLFGPPLALFELVLAQGQAGGLEQGLFLHRLGDVVEGAQAHRLGRGFHGRIAGDHHHRAGAAEFAHPPEQVDAGAAAEDDVADDQVEMAVVDLVQRLLVGRGGDHRAVALVLQEELKGVAQALLIVDDQDGGLRFAAVHDVSSPVRRLVRALRSRKTTTAPRSCRFSWMGVLM